MFVEGAGCVAGLRRFPLTIMTRVVESEREFQEETLDDLVRSCGPIGFDSLVDLNARQHRVSVSSRGAFG